MALIIENELTIDAPVAEVWNALIDPQVTPQYMFGCEVICNWDVGHPILWKGVEDGIVYVKGELLEFEQERIFSFTVFDPNAEYDDVPENYLTATYTLSQQSHHTGLKVTQGDYETVADGQKRYADTLSQGGWGAVLEGIKKIVEKR